MMEARRIRALAVLTVLMLSAFSILVSIPRGCSAYTSHAPILIDGNGNFTAANGVTGGSGTPSDPYVIEGWEIVASAAMGIDVRNTDVPFIIRGNYIHSGGSTFSGVALTGVRNGAIKSNNISGNFIGIRVVTSTDVAVAANNLSCNRMYGIHLWESTNTSITANHISFTNAAGIGFGESANVTVEGNDISFSQIGIAIDDSTNITLRANSLTSDGVFISSSMWPTYLRYFNTHTITPDNLINGKPLYYHKDCNGLTVDFIPVGELIVVNCTDVRVSNLDITDTDVAVEMAFVHNATVSDSRFSSNITSDTAFSLEASTDITIKANDITSNRYGFFLRHLTNVTIAANNVSGNEAGIYIDESRNVTVVANNASWNNRIGIHLGVVIFNAAVTANNASNNGHGGIYVVGSGGNMSFKANDVFSNSLFGIYVIGIDDVTVDANRVSSNGMGGIAFDWCNRCLVTANNVSNHQTGILLGDSTDSSITANNVAGNGLGISLERSVGILVHHNSILGNTVQASDDRGPENIWDDGYPSGGNWWSDYAGVDICSGPNQDICPDPDGIGDTPYVIDSESRDRFPLMAPYVDRSPPTVSIILPTEGKAFSYTPVLVSGIASEAGYSGLRRVEIRVNGGTWADATGTDSWTRDADLAHGWNLIEARAWDNAGNPSSIDSVNVTYNLPPIAAFTVTPTVGNVSTAFAVDASSSSDPWDPPTSLEVRWDWENDGVWDTSWSATKTAQHQFAVTGTYVIRLEVRDTSGAMDSTTRQVTVADVPPRALFNVSPTTGDVTVMFSVDASSSYDLEDPVGILEVRWDWNDDGVWDTDWSTAKVAQHQYDSPGAYRIRLEVRDSAGLTNTTTKAVSVESHTSDNTGVAVNPWLIVGLVTLAVILIMIVIFFLKRRKRNNEEHLERSKFTGLK